MKKLPSISRDFLSISATLAIIVIMLSIWFVRQVYTNQVNDIERMLESIAQRIERILIDDFEYTAYQMEYIATHIEQKHASKEEIFKILSSFKGSHKTNVAISWNMFSWVNKEDFLTVDGNLGIIESPPSVKSRDYMKCTKETPGKLCIGNIPVYGAVSKQWIIPAGLGVTNRDSVYLGSVIFGFDINSLTFKLEQAIANEDISFALINNYKIIAESANNKKFNSETDLIKLFKNNNLANRTKGLINYQSPLEKDIGYVYYNTLERYPANTIILSYNKVASHEDLIQLCMVRILEFFIFLVGALVTLYLIYKKIVDPIIAIAEAADQISAGDEDITFPKSRNYEILLLEEQLRKVIKFIDTEKTVKLELSNKSAQLEESNKEVTKINRILEQKINEKTFELKSALAAKSEFLNKMSMEIRTPVHTVINYTKSLAFGWQDMEETKRYQHVENIYKNCSKLLILMNNLLDLSKLDSGSMVFSILENDLIRITNLAISEVAKIYNHSANQILLHCEYEKIICHCDKDKIIQVVKNILLNAIKFSDNKPIDIHITKEFLNINNNQLVEAFKFSVEDQGVGIPPGEEEEIFEKFIQSTRTKVYGDGGGLGLAICMDIIIAHKGRIWAEEGRKSGSVFSFIIPKSIYN